MKSSRVTLRDVAQKLGVHTSTVSRVLNPETRHKYAPEMARRVHETVRDMGYHPNPIAYSLKTNRSLTIGVIIPDLTNPLFPPIIRGIENMLEEEGYTVILGNTDSHPERERTILNKMKARQVDGLILATAQMEDDLISELVAGETPVILINRKIKGDRFWSVVNNDFGGIELAVKHMTALGHTQIAHIAGPQQFSTGNDRYRGFLTAMEAEGLIPDPDLIAFCDGFSEEEGRKAYLELLKRGKSFTAVIAANDLLALGVYDALEEKGLRCPDDISVTGFNDMPFVDKLRPPLTTIHIPHYKMGAEAARILLNKLHGVVPSDQSILLEPELIVRGSTGAISSA